MAAGSSSGTTLAVNLTLTPAGRRVCNTHTLNVRLICLETCFIVFSVCGGILAPTCCCNHQHSDAGLPPTLRDNGNNSKARDFTLLRVLFRRCHRLPVGPQQEADDLLSEWTSAAARETGLLLGHVSSHTPVVAMVILLHSLPSPFPPATLLFRAFPSPSFCSSVFSEMNPFFFPSPLSGPVSLRQPASCHTSSVSLTLGPSLSVTHLLSSSAPSTTSPHCCPAKRSSYPGKK